MKPKALLLRVGADTGEGSGGFVGSISEDNSFEWTPMPRHDDPLWEELTYGDNVSKKENNRPAPKISQLQKLSKNDLLVFYAALKKKSINAIYIIGYYIIKKIYDLIEPNLPDEELNEIIKEINQKYKNPHVKFINKIRKGNLIIVGEAGGLLKKGIKIGSKIGSQYRMDPEFYFLNYYGDLTRAGSGHIISFKNMWNLLKDKELQKFKKIDSSEFEWVRIWKSLQKEEILEIIDNIKKKNLEVIDFIEFLTRNICFDDKNIKIELELIKSKIG